MNSKSLEVSPKDAERVFLVALQLKDSSEQEVDSSLDELQRLVDTLGAKVVGRHVQKRATPSPAYFIGKGKAEEVGRIAKEEGVTLLALDHELTGSQQKNLEKLLGLRVIDRTGIILDIFSRHARTKESKNQVEMAKLQYLVSRLTGRWTHLERQRGGIGLRGIGERQIELDRRMIRNRIAKLKVEIGHAALDRAVQRLHRDRFLRVAIVGYTNAGKSTLMNSLTMSEVYVDDRLFATLDSTVRVIDPKTRPPILLSDTVGFIRKLPHTLVASFRSTLQEVLEADLILHVVDLSAPEYMEQMEVAKQILEEIGAGEKPCLLVFNKADKCDAIFLPRIVERRYIDSLVVSAFRPEDMRRLREAIYQYFERDMLELEVIVPYRDTLLQSQIHEYAKVLEKEYLEEGTRFRIRMMRSDAHWLRLEEKAATKILHDPAGGVAV